MTKSTRRALLSSVVALVICLTMLIGTTFAWFTDTASTAVNTIQSGILDVDLVDKEGKSLEGKTLSFVNVRGEDDILWEPGCTFYTEGFKVVNNGNLALKYQVVVTGIKGDAELLKVIDFELVYENDESATGTLIPNAESATIKLKGHMDEDANNDYQDKTLENIAITVYATQWTYESDSINETYDANATLPTVATAEDLSNALSGEDDVNVVLFAGTYTLPAATEKTVTIHGTTDTVIDMANSAMLGAQNHGLDINFDGVTVKFDETDNYKGITHSSSVTYTNCVIEGKQFLYADNATFVNCTFINPDDYCVWTYGANDVTFEGCEFYTGGKAVLIYTEDNTHTNNVTVKNCKFYDDGNLDTKKAAIEIGDSQPTAGLTVNLTVENNEIYGFANNDEGTATGNKVWGNKNSIPADRLNVTANNNTEYDAVVGMYGTSEAVTKALRSTGKTIDITLTGDVEVTVDSATQWANAFGGSNTDTVTIDGQGKYTLTFKHPDSDANHVATNGAAVVLKNLTLKTSGYNDGPWNRHDIVFDCPVTMENVDVESAVALGDIAALTNVTISDNGEVYGLWIKANGQTVTLNNVEVNADRAIAIKDEYVGTPAKVTLNINGAKLVSTKKAGILVTSTAGATITASNVDISGVTADSTNLVWIDNNPKYQNINDTTVTGGTAVVEP